MDKLLRYLEPISETEIPSETKQPSWGNTLMGILLFLVWGLDLILGEIPHEWRVPSWVEIIRGAVFVLSFILLPSIGMAIGWVKKFPRWSYPYVFATLILGLYLGNASTPGLHVFGYETFGRELWGWRSWIPAITGLAIALLVSRTLRPALLFFSNGWRDWTLFSFGLFGMMPLIIAGYFDEIDRLFSLPFMIVLTIVMSGTALAVIRSRRALHRIIALVCGILCISLVSTIGTNAYWGRDMDINPIPLIAQILIPFIVMLFPIILNLLRTAIVARRMV